MQKAKVWAILGSVLAVAASIVTIVGFPYQVGLLRTAQSGERVPSTNISPRSGAVPISAEETEAWSRALADRPDCEAIRKYILDYPEGQFVSAAQTILSARREITEKRWIPFEFPSNVVAASSLESRANREAACASAREQMMANMIDGCSVFEHQPSRYRSVTVIAPRNTKCECQDEAIHPDDQTGNPLWRCSIRATYGCRGEQVQHLKGVACS